ncbi:MAG: SRPBCC family protein [Marinoscillum sp.]
MDTMEKTILHTNATVKAPIEKVWDCWTSPEHITKWNFADPSWHCPEASNDLKPGGRFSSTMAAKDGSMSFEFYGIYTEVIPQKFIAYEMGDGRKASIGFSQIKEETEMHVAFEAEDQNSLELQQNGWQAIHNNFKNYVETL